jgi:hypothetical protein
MAKVKLEKWLPFVPIGSHTQNTSLSTAVDITVPAGATAMMVQAGTQNVRFTLDNSTTNATTTVGFLLTAGDPPVIIPSYPGQIISVIEVTASAKLDYQFGREE